MFFGKVISQGNSFTYSEDTVDETVGDVISLSNAALSPNSKVDLPSYDRKTHPYL